MNKSKDENAFSCKIVFLEENNVGNHSIAKRYIENSFDLDLQALISPTYSSKIIELENINIRFELWSTPCQERYRSLNRHIYKNADACILGYDIT